jgi:hypothetical protein
MLSQSLVKTFHGDSRMELLLPQLVSFWQKAYVRDTEKAASETPFPAIRLVASKGMDADCPRRNAIPSGRV